MKLFSLLLLPALFVFSSFASAEMPPTPADREVQIGITGVYAPGGFTASSEAFVVVNGVFQNGCYRWKKADVKHRDDFVHEIRSYAAVSPGMCIMVLVPFQKEIRLGHLRSGSHTLRFDNGDGTYFEKALEIR